MRFRLRYSLKVFLLIWLVIGLGLGWFGVHWQSARRQAAALSKMTTGSASYDYEAEAAQRSRTGGPAEPEDMEFADYNRQQPKDYYKQLMNVPLTPLVPPEPEWLISCLGVDFFHPITSFCYPAMSCAHEEHKLTVGLDKEMDQLAELPHIREFYLRPADIDVPQVMESSLFTNLGKLRELEELWLGGLPLKAEHLAPLRDHPKLKKLTLISDELTDEALAALGTLPALEELNLYFCAGLGKTDLAFLRHWKKLRTVELVGTPCDGRVLVRLKELPKLEALNLSQTNITAKTLTELRDLPNLRRINLSELLFTDAELAAAIHGWSNLQTLDVSSTQADKLFAAECRNLQRLEFLNLRYTPLSDDEALSDQIIQQLTDCKVELGSRGGLFSSQSLGDELPAGAFTSIGGGMDGGLEALESREEDSQNSDSSDETLDPSSAAGEGYF